MAESPLTFEELFDPDFLASLQGLRIVAGRVAHGGRPAEQRSKDLGSGIEFRDFRPYTSGDEFKAIDWNIYRRLGRVFLRLFEELEDLPVYLMPDISDSMYTEDPPRAIPCLRTALALSSIALHQHDSVGLFPFGEDLKEELRPSSGKARVYRMATKLTSLRSAGGTDFERTFNKLQHRKLRQGLVVVISDFFDPKGIEAVTGAMKPLRHRLLLVQLVRPDDRVPALSGDLQLRDCETGDIQDVSVTQGVIQKYTDAYDRWQENLVTFAKSQGAGLIQLDCEKPVVPQLATLFERGAYVV